MVELHRSSAAAIAAERKLEDARRTERGRDGSGWWRGVRKAGGRS